MGPQEFEWVSESIPPDKQQEVMESLPMLFRKLVGDCLVQAIYGWGCGIHMDLCYLPMRVGTQWIDRFIKESLEQKIVVPGQSDFYFELHDERVEILFCHEGDIHVSGPDEEMINKIFDSKPFSSITFKKHPKKPDSSESAARLPVA